MKTLFVTTSCLVIVVSILLATASRSYAEARASASGSIADASFPADFNTDAVAATAQLTKDNGDASTFFTSMAEVNGPTLKAFARAGLSSTSQDFTTVGTALARWSDVLVLDNADVFAGVFQTMNAYAYFQPTARGILESDFLLGGPEATFFASISDGMGDSQFTSGDTSQGDNIHLRMRFPLAAFEHDINLVMSLLVTAEAKIPGTSVSSDYSHTAILPPIIIGDQYGNPIPGLPDPQFVGQSGFSYSSVTDVPAPIGDYNANGVVDDADYVVWRNSLGQSVDLSADGNGDEQIDVEDYNIWRAHFGQVIGGGDSAHATAIVPEPASIALLFAAATVFSNRVRRRAG